MVMLPKFSTILVLEGYFIAVHSYTSNLNLNSSNELITDDMAINSSTVNYSVTEYITSIVDFIREKKEFVKLSIFIHQTGSDLKHHKSAVKLWNELWKLGLSALVSIVQQPAVEREINGEYIIFFSNEELSLENAVTMMSRIRPLYFISANIECNVDLTEISTSIPADIEVYVVSLCDGIIYEAYHFDPDLPVVRAVARKDDENGIWFLITEQSMWMRRKKMDGLKIYGKGYRPLIFDRDDPLFEKMVSSDRYAVEVWDDLSRFLNFTSSPHIYSSACDKRNLAISENQNRLVIANETFVNSGQNSTPWDGMLGLLGSQEIDVTTNFVTVTEQAADGYAMRATVFTTSFQLIFHSPFGHKHALMPNVLYPFNENVWIALVCMLVILLPFALSILLRKETELGNATLLPLRCITSQGLGFSPERTSARVGCLVTLFFCYLMIMFYESVLITFLTSSDAHRHPFSTLEEFYAKGYGFDLIYHDEISWALMGDWHRSTSEDSDPISKLALGIPPPKGNRVLAFGSRKKAGKRICRNPENTTIFDLPYRQVHFIKCPYITAKHKYLLMHLGIGARHNLSAYPFMTRMIRSMNEYGIIDRIKQSFRNTQHKSTFKPLSLVELGTIFTLYHYAVLFSIVILTLELLWFYTNQTITNKSPLKNKFTRRRYHNKRIKDLQNVLDKHVKFKRN